MVWAQPPTKDDTMLSQSQLKELLDYDPKTGEFTWRTSRYKSRIGTVAGWINNIDGYRRIQIKPKIYMAHRLAWLYVHGRWPVEYIDHINGIKTDNRIANLRECTNAENHQNKGKYNTNTSGYTGVTWDKSTKKWKAQIKKNGKIHYLGYYDTPQAAYQAYLDAKARLHTFNPKPR